MWTRASWIRRNSSLPTKIAMARQVRATQFVLIGCGLENWILLACEIVRRHLGGPHLVGHDTVYVLNKGVPVSYVHSSS